MALVGCCEREWGVRKRLSSGLLKAMNAAGSYVETVGKAEIRQSVASVVIVCADGMSQLRLCFCSRERGSSKGVNGTTISNVNTTLALVTTKGCRV